jgi:hypothetical protein
MILADVIKELRLKYLAENQFTDFSQINSGQCENFSEELTKAFPGSFTIGAENFQTSDGRFDWTLLKKWRMSPPTGMTEEDVDNLELGGHLWLTLDYRHYDAECPEGVDSFFDLPFFQRQAKRPRSNDL